MDFSPFLQKAQNDKFCRPLQNDKMRFLCPSLRASKASVAIHKFKQTLSQKFKQSLKKPKNSANRPQAHHKNFQWIATNLHAYALQILAMTKSLSYCLICCHTERSEVSTCEVLLCGKKTQHKILILR